MSTALARIEPSAPVAATRDEARAFEPRGIPEALQLAQTLVASRLLPRSVATPEAAFAIIATGRELGLTAMQSLRSIHVIEGKPTLSADLICALVKQRGDVCAYFRLVESTDQVATYETHRKGEPEPTRMSFSMADANRAGVTGKDNWRKYPAAMLRARCITALARAVYPDLAMGLYDPDEVTEASAPAEYTVTPEPARAAPAPPNSAPRATSAAVFADLCARVDAAETGRALSEAAVAAARAHKAGAIDDSQLEQIRSAGVAKRKLLETPAPGPAQDPEAAVEREPGSDDV